MIFVLDFVDERFGEFSSFRVRDRLEVRGERMDGWIDRAVPYRCRRRGVERFSSRVFDAFGVIA